MFVRNDDFSARESTTKEPRPSNDAIKRFFLFPFSFLSSHLPLSSSVSYLGPLLFLAPRRLTSVVHAGQVGAIRTVQLGSGLVAFQSRLLRASPPRCSTRKKRGRKGGRRALFRFGCVWNLFSSFPGQRVLDRRDQWGPLVLTLSNSTRCILTAVLSPHYVSHSPAARHRNQIHHKERPPRICPEQASRHVFIENFSTSRTGKCDVILYRYIHVCFDSMI